MKTVLLADKNYRNHTKGFFLERTLDSLLSNGNDHHLHVDDNDLNSIFDLKVRRLREILSKYQPDEVVMLIDAFDTYSVANDSEIELKFLETGADVLYSVEKNCWPEPQLESFFEHEKFLNAGGIIFKNAKFQKLLDVIIAIRDCTVKSSNLICDQYFHSLIGAVFQLNVKVQMDLNCQIFQSLHSEKLETFKKVDGRFINTSTGTEPCIFHGNGESGFELLVTLFKREPDVEQIEDWPEPADRRALMIQVWFGKIPDYFKYHLATTWDLEGFDFLIITDDPDFQTDAPNYKKIQMSKSEFGKRFFEKTGRTADLTDSKKVSDFKICLADLFSDLTREYSHVGFYDIDTLFSKMVRTRAAMQEDWDFITLADTGYADRLNGPFVLIRNRPHLVKAYRTPECYADLVNPKKTDCDEKSYSQHVCQNFRVKKIWDCRNVEHHAGGKISYLCRWKSGELTTSGRQLEQYHFYHKDRTRLRQLADNSIVASYDKVLADDFMWVTGFTEDYSQIGYELLKSIVKYSNRKCLVYSIDFDWAMPIDLVASEQIQVRRFDLNKPGMDQKTRTAFMNAKPLYLIDAVDFLPEQKFAYIDSDAAVTASADEVRHYFNDLENYPLINSHTHDNILVMVDGEWINSLQILLDKMQSGRTVYPRRKCNFMVFDRKSRWFFEEQLKLYDDFAGTDPNIFAVYDEDSANALLSKYELSKGLPIIDIEESTDLDMHKYSSYSYAMSAISEHAIVPDNPNKILIFHQLKSEIDFAKIEQDYGQTTIDQEGIILRYSNNCVSWERNSHRPNPRLPGLVHFTVNSEDGHEVFRLSNQYFMRYWTFCIWDLPLAEGTYFTQMLDASTGRIMYCDRFTVN